MCIAIYKPAEKSLPSDEILRRCFTRNKDGGGFAYAKGGRVRFVKGLMTIEDFLEEVKQVEAGLPMLLHFRIGTHGGKGSEYTHPFPLTHHMDSLYMLRGSCPFPVVVHNGIISGFGDNGVSTPVNGSTRRPMSDTQDFIRSMSKGTMSKEAAKVAAAGSRLAFLSPDGTVEMWGSWEESEGIHYSNSGYKPSVAVGTCDPRNWGGRYGQIDDDMYDENGCYLPYSQRGRRNRGTVTTDYIEDHLQKRGLSRSTPILTHWGDVTTIGDLLTDYGLNYYSLDEYDPGMLGYSIGFGANNLPLPLGEFLLADGELEGDGDKEGNTLPVVASSGTDIQKTDTGDWTGDGVKA